MARPAGCYRFTDRLDDDGQGQEDIPIRLVLAVSGERVHSARAVSEYGT
jgi:hypothetical protein